MGCVGTFTIVTDQVHHATPPLTVRRQSFSASTVVALNVAQSHDAPNPKRYHPEVPTLDPNPLEGVGPRILWRGLTVWGLKSLGLREQGPFGVSEHTMADFLGDDMTG